MQISSEAKKPLLVGEFGTSETSVTNRPGKTSNGSIAVIHDEGVPLAAVWVFDLPNQPENTITGTNVKAYQLDRIHKVNESYVNEDAIRQVVDYYETAGQIAAKHWSASCSIG